MIIVLLNCCGLGTKNKFSGVRDPVFNEKLEAIGIQEAKKEVIESGLVKSLWGLHQCDFVFSPSSGACGGTLLIWDSSVFHKCKSNS